MSKNKQERGMFVGKKILIVFNGWERLVTSLGATLFCLYAPFSWVLLIPIFYGWSDHHLSWLIHWPILPGFIPACWFFQSESASAMYTAIGITTVLLIVVLTYIATRGQVGTFIAVLLGFLISVPSSLMAYVTFQY